MIDFKKLYEHIHEPDNALRYADALLEPDNQNRRGPRSDMRSRGWICPACGNGSGEDGDGIKYNVNSSKPGYFKCFKCDFYGDIVDIVGLQNNITDSVEKARKTIEVLGLDSEVPGILEFNPGHSGKFGGNSPSGANTAPPVAPVNHTLQRQPLKEAINNTTAESKTDDRIEAALDQLRNSMDMGAWESSDKYKEAMEMADFALEGLKTRGITPGNPLLAYVGAFQNEKVGGLTFESCYAFFGGLKSYSVRDVNPAAERKASKPTGVPDIPFGLLSVILEPEKCLPDMRMPEPVFICEGAVDALSLAEAGADAVALNGIGNVNIILKAFEEFGVKRPVVLAMDEDKVGRDAQARIAKELGDAGIEHIELKAIPDYLKEKGVKDPNDFLRVDRELFERWVQAARRFQVNEFEYAFNKNQKEWLCAKLLELGERGAIKTGFDTLDSEDYLDGGLYPGLYLIGAVSSMGKTTFALQLADQIAAGGTDVIFCSLEMPKEEVMTKSISRYTLTNLIEAGKLRPGEKADDRAKNLRQIEREFGENKDITAAMERYFADTGEHMKILEGMGNVSAAHIAGIVKQHIDLTGRRPVIFVDYLQLLIQPSDRPGGMTDKQIVDANIFKLKQISRDYNVPIVAISSFNRDNYNNPASMVSFKESGGIEYSSDVLIGLEPAYMGASGKSGANGDVKRESAKKLYEEREKNMKVRDMRIVIIKNRNGQKGGVVYFSFYSANNCFLEDKDGKIKSRYKIAS